MPKLVSHSRAKRLNAIVFFARNTRFCGKVKLFKLLYLLDFEHFRETGRSVTGFAYSAWEYGPVPAALAQEWDEPSPDMLDMVSIVPETVIDYVREKVVARVDFDPAPFSPREIRIMNHLAAKYRDVYSPKMIDVTHAENGAWARVWNDGEGFNQRIPYDLALDPDDPNREAILGAAKEYAEISSKGTA